MHQLKFYEACVIQPPDKDSSIFRPEIAVIYDRFYSNMGIAVSSNMMPGYVFWTALEWASASTKANVDIIGSHRLPQNDYEKSRVGKRAEQYFEKSMMTDTGTWKQNIREKTETFERFVAHSGEYIFEMTHGLLKSMIINAHTAYEVYVGDLLEELRSHHRDIFPKTSYTYKSTGKFFDAYNNAFKDPAVSDAVLTPEIRAIALIRNVIVHSNCIADDWFMSRDKAGYPTNAFLLKELPPIKEHDEIKIDGLLVRLLIESCAKQARLLAVEVNKWLVSRLS